MSQNTKECLENLSNNISRWLYIKLDSIHDVKEWVRQCLYSIKEQFSTMDEQYSEKFDKMEKLHSEQIALLESRIAELEKKNQ